MTGLAVTRMSSKGQIVIPVEMRDDLPEGEQILVIRHEGSLILKRASQIDDSIADDLKFAKRTEEALRRYEQGKFKRSGKEEFLAALDKW
ncbi:AbrB/MazE/SpoVT family DNA-binding domain-containing protein [Candidatus Woesearchaeota archaeon]|nr:AbrB/MazE/SpoVT family DNA-binding domain-containing protein [Candidatus Woesearchaeota archaeon]